MACQRHVELRGFNEIGDAFPGLDLALMPSGAYDPR
jgi:hypothetical protein